MILLLSIQLMASNTPVEVTELEETLMKMKRIEVLYRKKFSSEQYEFIKRNPSKLSLLGTPQSALPHEKKPRKRQYRHFKYVLAKRESANDSSVVNQYGMIGLYQFSPGALKDCGVSVDVSEFKVKPWIFNKRKQNNVMDRWVKVLYGYMSDYIEKYDGKRVQGVKIDLSSIIAGAHLVGPNAMKQWLDSHGKKVKKDGNGVNVIEYLKLFQGYDLASAVK